ncbi:MAG: T9SS type A sorting domain-containing protein [Chitinophagaceae bacterium]
MKKFLFSAALLTLLSPLAWSQITITAADMPIGPSGGAPFGDTLRYSNANPAALSINLTDTGTNKVWDFSGLVAISQSVDTYKNAAQVNVSYVVTISPTAYGIKIADSLPGAPISVQDIYNFYNKKTSPSRFVTVGFAAKISGFPIPINYSTEDVIYYFPLSYPHPTDVSNFRLSYSLPGGLGYFSQTGTRTTRVDAWGTIKTPYANAVSVIRVRSEIAEMDTVTFGTTSQGIPRNTVEYKWLANGEHYPLLSVTTTVIGGTETPTSVTYRDTKRSTLNVFNTPAKAQSLELYPNPAVGDIVNIKVPTTWSSFSIKVYDPTGKLVSESSNKLAISVAGLASGKYLVFAESGSNVAFAQFVK